MLVRAVGAVVGRGRNGKRRPAAFTTVAQPTPLASCIASAAMIGPSCGLG